MKKHTKVVTVEYIVQDCPICGKVIVKHYLEKGKDDGKQKPIYFKHCYRCGCEFEFSTEDVKSKFDDQREGYTVLYVPCPHCGDTTGVEDKPIRYE